MPWQPISEAEIWDELNAAQQRMSPAEQRLWQVITIAPEKWSLPPWSDEGGGFWAVGLIGQQVVWYNDIEDGFNISDWRRYGQIEDYWCDQDELEWAVQKILNEIETGQRPAYKMGPPQPLEQ